MPKEQDLQDIISQKVRLGILSVLVVSREVPFQDLKAQLDVTDGNLSSHLRMLEKHELVEIEKTFENRRPKTTVCITKKGRTEFNAFLNNIEELIMKHRKGKGDK